MGRWCRTATRVVVLSVLALVALSATGCATKPVAPEALAPKITVVPGEAKNVKTIYVAGGCFWGIEKYFELIHGVVYTETGYANGASNSATYGDASGYAEAVRVDYDPAVAPLPFLLRLFYKAIDPTSIDQQGNDVGTEYRSGVYYTDPADQPVVEASLVTLRSQYSRPLAIETGPLKAYSRAEDYHQRYLDNNPNGYCHIPLNLFSMAASATPLPSDFGK